MFTSGGWVLFLGSVTRASFLYVGASICGTVRQVKIKKRSNSGVRKPAVPHTADSLVHLILDIMVGSEHAT